MADRQYPFLERRAVSRYVHINVYGTRDDQHYNQPEVTKCFNKCDPSWPAAQRAAGRALYRGVGDGDARPMRWKRVWSQEQINRLVAAYKSRLPDAVLKALCCTQDVTLHKETPSGKDTPLIDNIARVFQNMKAVRDVSANGETVDLFLPDVHVAVCDHDVNKANVHDALGNVEIHIVEPDNIFDVVGKIHNRIVYEKCAALKRRI